MENPKTGHKFEDFPVGTRVKVISKVVDFNFFGGETGEVVKNTGSYLGIRVKFDKPRHFRDGSVQHDFNFNPQNLEPTPQTEKLPAWVMQMGC